MKKGWIVGILYFFMALGHAAQGALPASQAFEFSGKQEGAKVILQWNIAPGYYLYKEHFKFELMPEGTIPLGKVLFPSAIQKQDKFSGKHQVYAKQLKLVVPLSDALTNKSKLQVTYQGCSEKGFCYPPMKQVISLDGVEKEAGLKNISEAKESFSERMMLFFQEGGVFVLLLGFFGFGILLSFTPCVLPMIPILSSIILGQEGKLGTFRSFSLSLLYVLGMSIAYAIAGVLAGLAGSHLQAYMQCPLVLTTFSILFIILALSLFGLFDLRLPSFLQHHATHLSNKQKSGSFIGAFFMGFLSILIVSPCVSAPLVAALSLISQRGNLVLGGFALWIMGLGMGLPLLLLGTFGPRLLPKTGKWMHVVKAFFGVIMLGLAITLISRFLPEFISLVLWGGLLIITAINMGIFTPLPNRGIERAWQGVAYILFVYGIILLVGAAQGNGNPLMPLKKEKKTFEKSDLSFHIVKTPEELSRALSKAKGHYAMIDFSAKWCMSCKQMEAFTFTNRAVQEKLKNLVLIKADISSVNEATTRMQKKYDVIAPPTLLFFNPAGKFLKEKTLVGEVDADKLLKSLETLE